MQQHLSLVFAFLAILLYTVEAQIPYSYASGRDEGAVERRFAAFNAAKSRGASRAEIDGICGAVSATTSTACTTTIGRPSDSQTNTCDSVCCHLGFKVGNCGTNLEGQSFSIKDLTIESALSDLRKVAAECRCSNDRRVVRCGNDGSWRGIRCPFDNSACWRKCCLEGREGGSCGGFLRTRCRCHD